MGQRNLIISMKLQQLNILYLVEFNLIN